MPPPVTARGSGGALIARVWGEAPAAFLLLRLFSMKFDNALRHAISGLLEPA